MIHKISIENFFSIDDKQEINFLVPANAPEGGYNRTSWADPRKRVTSVAAIFGANASGKSTILRSITATVDFLKHSRNSDVGSNIPQFMPYAKAVNYTRPTKISFELDGRLNEYLPPAIFRYELHINHNEKSIGTEVLFESLSYAPHGKFRSLFKREKQEFEFSKDFEIPKSDPRISFIRSNVSIISVLAQFNHILSIKILEGISSLQTNIVGLSKLDYGHHSNNNILKYYYSNPNELEDLNNVLARIDLGLEKLEFVNTPNGIAASFRHLGLDLGITYEHESIGTQRFIGIFAQINYGLKLGGVVIIDELDSDIHPLLIPEILSWFKDHDKNQYGAQILFTAHNPTIMDFLEKEQVFFTEKPSGKSTVIYSAKDIQGLRREPSMMKKYLSGELGAVPHIG